MRRIWTVIRALVTLGATFALPATTAAATTQAGGYSFTTLHNSCDRSNSIEFGAKVTAARSTNANRETIDSFAQRPINGQWQTVYAWPRSARSFPVNGRNHSLSAWRWYRCSTNHRIVLWLRIWHNTALLAQATIHSVQC